MAPSGDAIERGWDCLEGGDLEGAVAALGEAQRGQPVRAEVLCLAGAVAAASGDVAEALAHLGRATELEPDLAHPLIQACELELYSRGDAERAAGLARRAGQVAEDDEERADALVLLAEAELARADDAAARIALAALADLEVGDPVLWTRAGETWLALGDDDRAEHALARAVDLDPGQADAHHALGLLYQDRGDRAAMIRAFRECRRLDQAAPPLPWHISAARFEAIARAALAELPPAVRDRLETVPVRVDDLPDPALVDDGLDPRLLALFTGVPLPDRRRSGGEAAGGGPGPGRGQADGPAPAIDAIHLFQRNLERHCTSADDLAGEIRIAVLQQAAHFFGLDDDQLARCGPG